MKKSNWDYIKGFALELVRKKSKEQVAETEPSTTALALQLGILSGLLVDYYYLVLIFLPNWFKSLFDHNKLVYAIVAWAFIAIQGVLVEVIGTALLRVLRAKIK